MDYLEIRSKPCIWNAPKMTNFRTRPDFKNKIIRLGFLLGFFVLLIGIPALNILQPSRINTTNPSVAWCTVVLFGFIFLTLIYFSFCEFFFSGIRREIKLIFLGSTLTQCFIIFLISLAPTLNLLYWDSFHVVRLTSESILGDWRSFFFEGFSLYILQIIDHVYAVSFTAVIFYTLALNIPILFCANKNQAIKVSGIAFIFAISPHYMVNGAMFFTDTFFASFSLMSIYSLILLTSKLNQSPKPKINDLRAPLAMFILTGLAAVNFRHNGVVLAAFLIFGLIALSKKRLAGISIAFIFATSLLMFNQIKESNLFPDANSNSIHTNRNFQKVALVLNFWGALLNAKGGYVTDSVNNDLKRLSYFIAPEIVSEKYDVKNPVALWEVFASPWRLIDSEKTNDFMQISVIRVFQNLPIFVADRVHFALNMLLKKDGAVGLEKDCALGLRSSCPNFGDESKTQKYNEQIRQLTFDKNQFIARPIKIYQDLKYSGLIVLIAISYFLYNLTKKDRNIFCVLLSLYGLSMFCALVITLPSPEYRYFFPITMIFACSILMGHSGYDLPPHSRTS